MGVYMLVLSSDAYADVLGRVRPKRINGVNG